VRLAQTLYAEYPDLKSYLERLEREKAQQTASTLAAIWETDEAAARRVAERLVEIGFFERRGSNDQPAYWVPFLYRDALSLVQGEAR
jgi:predicted transcriptional regulator